MLALIAEHGLGDLDDAWRIATPNTPIPYSPPLEDAHLPGAERLADEIRRRLGKPAWTWTIRSVDERPRADTGGRGSRLRGLEGRQPPAGGAERVGISLRELARRVGVSRASSRRSSSTA